MKRQMYQECDPSVEIELSQELGGMRMEGEGKSKSTRQCKHRGHRRIDSERKQWDRIMEGSYQNQGGAENVPHEIAVMQCPEWKRFKQNELMASLATEDEANYSGIYRGMSLNLRQIERRFLEEERHSRLCLEALENKERQKSNVSQTDERMGRPIDAADESRQNNDSESKNEAFHTKNADSLTWRPDKPEQVQRVENIEPSSINSSPTSLASHPSVPFPSSSTSCAENWNGENQYSQPFPTSTIDTETWKSDLPSPKQPTFPVLTSNMQMIENLKQAILSLQPEQNYLPHEHYSPTAFFHYQAIYFIYSQYNDHITRFKEQHSQSAQSIEQLINKIFSQISCDPKQIVDKACELLNLINQHQTNAEHDGELYYLLECISFRLLAQSKNIEHSYAFFAYAEVVNFVASKFPLLLDFIIHSFHQHCPYTIPVYPQRRLGQSDSQFMLQELKYTKKELSHPAKYFQRMKRYMYMYAAILNVQSSGHMQGLQAAWAWVSRILNVEPEDITAHLLDAFFEQCGYSMLHRFGRQAAKLIDFLKSVYMKKLKSGAELEILKATLDEIASKKHLTLALDL
ncbi:uncharacterized protein LOC126320485 [Schistocerca gregaria]|uniref:uncharacterized protein LOC126320485 n=1 Tax=Schistocerca gregaria TaxID=7010 RepID=UPI00211F3043|nr:uncharacterized protein LOC126320485 [Schistocerca gregaria]